MQGLTHGGRVSGSKLTTASDICIEGSTARDFKVSQGGWTLDWSSFKTDSMGCNNATLRIEID